MIIYGLGHLDSGRPETWKRLEELLYDNFENLRKIDFDHTLAGFSLGSVKKGSSRLLKLFAMCAKQNYGQAGANRSHEDFILAASYIGKDRDKAI